MKPDDLDGMLRVCYYDDMADRIQSLLDKVKLDTNDRTLWTAAFGALFPENRDLLLELFESRPELIAPLTEILKRKMALAGAYNANEWTALVDDEAKLIQQEVGV